MANAGVRGRPIEPLVLSAQERAYLERQVRRHRVARSLSERCRAILRCADGLPSKSVAAQLGIHAVLAHVADEPLRIRLLGNMRFPCFQKTPQRCEPNRNENPRRDLRERGRRSPSTTAHVADSQRYYFDPLFKNKRSRRIAKSDGLGLHLRSLTVH